MQFCAQNSVHRVAAPLLPAAQRSVGEADHPVGLNDLVPLHGRTAGLLEGHNAADGDGTALPVQAQAAVGRLIAVPVLAVGTRGGELRVRHNDS